MTTTLTDRYIAATVRSLPPQLQAEVRDELRASIADAVDARTEQGEPLEAAERAVLSELGDPSILAAGYADRPLHLIGPKYFLTWWRLLKVLVAIVPACAFGGVVIAQALAGGGIGQIIGEGIAVGLAVTVHLAFWTTLVFVILERTGADTGVRWSVDRLPDDATPGAGRGELIASLMMLAVLAGAVIWDRFRGFVFTGDSAVPLLNPDLWPWGTGSLFAIMAADAALAVAVYARGRWTSALAWGNIALDALLLSLALPALGRGELFNQAFVELLAAQGVDADARTVLGVLAGLGIAAICIGDGIGGWRRSRRAQVAG